MRNYQNMKYYYFIHAYACNLTQSEHYYLSTKHTNTYLYKKIVFYLWVHWGYRRLAGGGHAAQPCRW